MDVGDTIIALHHAGVRIIPHGDADVGIYPSGRITQTLRDGVRAHKSQLRDWLDSEWPADAAKVALAFDGGLTDELWGAFIGGTADALGTGKVLDDASMSGFGAMLVHALALGINIRQATRPEVWIDGGAAG